MSMKRKLFNIDKNTPFSLIGLEKKSCTCYSEPFSIEQLSNASTKLDKGSMDRYFAFSSGSLFYKSLNSWIFAI